MTGDLKKRTQISTRTMLAYIAALSFALAVVVQAESVTIKVGGFGAVMGLLAMLCFAICRVVKASSAESKMEVLFLFVGNIGGLLAVVSALCLMWAVIGALLWLSQFASFATR